MLGPLRGASELFIYTIVYHCINYTIVFIENSHVVGQPVECRSIPDINKIIPAAQNVAKLYLWFGVVKLYSSTAWTLSLCG